MFAPAEKYLRLMENGADKGKGKIRNQNLRENN
jgi:hypothetical protein